MLYPQLTNSTLKSSFSDKAIFKAVFSMPTVLFLSL